MRDRHILLDWGEAGEFGEIWVVYDEGAAIIHPHPSLQVAL